MSRKQTQKEAYRDRNEVARNSVFNAGKPVDTTAFLAAAGAATLGVLQAGETHAANGRSPTPKTDIGTRPADDGGQSSSTVRGLELLADGTHQQLQVPGMQLASGYHPGSQTDASTPVYVAAAPAVAPAADQHETGAPDLAATHAVSYDSASDVPAVPDEVVTRVAEQIASTVQSVVAAAQGGDGDGIGDVLARDILQTATNIVEGIRAQIPGAGDLSDIGDGVHLAADAVGNTLGTISGTVQDTVGALPDLVGHVQEATAHIPQVVSSVPVIDLLDGRTGFDPPPLAADGLVGQLTGSATAITTGLAGAVSDVAAIPSSVLGGADGEKGILTQVFYDDGGGSDIGATVDTMADATKPADLGFLGQPLSGAEELTGIFHGSSALHLV
ncbi:hypothetical protein AAIH46_14520 [Rhizobium sp. 0TCS1.26]|uniref:hypothetical protein n=1 Tax=Rhizobium sp. 0TCS1.26 TaxID=3142623 RepID=UPI003D2CB1DB